jgi:hypothetical protein
MIKRKAINIHSHGVCGVITAHYHKDGVSNILPNTKSQIKAVAILIEYD